MRFNYVSPSLPARFFGMVIVISVETSTGIMNFILWLYLYSFIYVYSYCWKGGIIILHDPIIEVNNLTKSYSQGSFRVLDKISFSLHKGDLAAIVGESGSGKTTLLNILFGLVDYEEGSCKINNINLHNLSLNEKQKFRHDFMGYVPQDYGLIEEWSVYDNIMLPLMFYKNNSIKKASIRLNDIFKSMHRTPADTAIPHPTPISSPSRFIIYKM